MTHKTRHNARRFAVQALYQWHMTAMDELDLMTQFLAGKSIQTADIDYFQKLTKGTLAKRAVIDEHIQTHIDRNFDTLHPIELACMRLGSYELLDCLDVPYKVVINEAVELAKEFGSQDGHKYVNSILDKIAGGVRATEVKSR
ncbi:MAG: N utilization substance protein B [marine bacterium B5-7]|nr:MAG: N utilization substance protein B [marine bacterium B5-7]